MSGALRKATHARHYAAPPQITDKDGSKHWITRAANFVVVVTEAKEGAVLSRQKQPDEYMAIIAPVAAASLEADGAKEQSTGDSFAIFPPGDSKITVTKPGTIARIFSNKADDLCAAAVNAAAYADGAPEVTPITPWPDPVGGFKLRHYKLTDYKSPDSNPLKMRIFRSTNLMVDIFEPWTERRNESKLSPHSHEDFEQVSLGLKGGFAHHMRYPWTPDKATWREDEHEIYVSSPSVLVIPARVIHTSHDVGDGVTWLIDVFGPPRRDFSEKPGMVLNAKDYPMPA